MHQKDTNELVAEVVGLLLLVPERKVDEILRNVENVMFTLSIKNENYENEWEMIRKGEEKLKERQLYWVMANTLREGRQSYGFTKKIEHIYKNPLNGTEREISAAYRSLHIDVLAMFLDVTEPDGCATSFIHTDEAYVLFKRLGANVPEKLISGMKNHLNDYYELDPDANTNVRALLKDIITRFPS